MTMQPDSKAALTGGTPGGTAGVGWTASQASWREVLTVTGWTASQASWREVL